jgi:hypothetical protein
VRSNGYDGVPKPPVQATTRIDRAGELMEDLEELKYRNPGP